jgi:hypothetical protein
MEDIRFGCFAAVLFDAILASVLFLSFASIVPSFAFNGEMSWSICRRR